MQRTKHNHLIDDPEIFKANILNWAQQFDEIVWLDSNNSNQKNSPYNFSDYDAVLAVDSHQCIESSNFSALKEFQKNTNDYLFGYLSYDLKNDLENLNSKNEDGIKLPELFFFQPKKIFFFKKNKVEMHYLLEFKEDIQEDISAIKNAKHKTQDAENLNITPKISKPKYLEKVKKALDAIHRGDIYEVNFCQEFFAKNTTINPLNVYQKLNRISTPPFATFLKTRHHYLLSASPERFLKRIANKIISQPIKGTIKRGRNKIEDEVLKRQLKEDLKERAENVMIVDLVRNDLSRTAIKGSVKVDELCEVYAFKQVHQMISTISSEVEKNTNSIDIIKSMFPMGSMTGAPKVSAMKIIENLEETKRGLYSGAVGYFAPNGSFDLNVIIRSILYNQQENYVSYSVGSAITSNSIPEKEYEECLLKAKALREVLLNSN